MHVSVVWALLLSSLTVQGQQHRVDDSRVLLGTLNTMPEQWLGKTVTACGMFRSTDPDLLLSHLNDDPSGVFVQPSVKRTEGRDGTTCVTGTFSRKDGLTKADMIRLRIPHTNYVDTYNPDYIINQSVADPRTLSPRSELHE